MKLYCLKTVISVMCAVLPVLSFGKDWDCIVDGTMYSLDDENKTAQVKYVGGENVFIPDYITNSGIKYAVNSVSPGANVGLDIKTIVVDDKNEYLDSRNACNAVVDKQSNEIVLGCMNTVIPNSIVSIGERAFRGCKNLMSITIPNSIVSIGERAFRDCKNLSSITIPSSVSFIGSNAFEGCENLKLFSINSNSIVSANEGLRDLFGQEIPMVETVIIGESVINIGNSVLSNFSKLVNLTLPCSIVSISDYAFSGCSLTSVNIPNSVTTIGEYNQEIKGETNVGIIPVST